MNKAKTLNIDKVLLQSKKALKKGDIVLAMDLYGHILQCQPDNPVAKKGLEKLNKALLKDNSLAKNNDTLSHEQKNILIDFYYSGQLIRAEQLCLELQKDYPQELFIVNLLGATYKAQGRLEEALLRFSQAAQLDPKCAETHCNYGVALKDSGRLVEALVSYDLAIQIKSDYAEAFYNRGNALKELGRQSEAVVSYDQAIQLNLNYAEAYCNRGNTFIELGWLNEALASLDQAILLKPDFAEAYANRGNVFEKLDKLVEAMACFDKAVELQPNYAEAYSNRGNTLQKLGHLQEALASLDQAILLKPDFAEAYANRGNVFQELGQLVEAMTCFDKAISLKPDLAGLYVNRGNAFKELGHLPEALASLDQAIELKPDYAEAHYIRGIALYYMDDLAQAVIAFETALTIDPINAGLNAAVYLAILFYLVGDIEKCRNALLVSQPILLKVDLKSTNEKKYWHYLNKLLNFHQYTKNWNHQTPGVKILHVVGESHALSAHGAIVHIQKQEMCISSQWIVGCKQWHLANSDVNIYKQKLESIMERLPEKSTIYFAIGEIDCRHDEGIIKAWEKCSNKSLPEFIQLTVTSYIDYVNKIVENYGHKVIIGGIPATNFPLETLTETLAEQFVHTIHIFNIILKKHALATGMGFLDLYALTNRGDGIASGEWHIDSTHLIPSALVVAFERYYLE